VKCRKAIDEVLGDRREAMRLDVALYWLQHSQKTDMTPSGSQKVEVVLVSRLFHCTSFLT
jgi:hypothetical protein